MNCELTLCLRCKVRGKGREKKSVKGWKEKRKVGRGWRCQGKRRERKGKERREV